MLNNITLGQYYPADSVVHKLDPRVKILLLVALIVGIFLGQNLLSYVPVAAFLFLAARLSKVPFSMLLKGLKPLRFILVFTFVLNIFFLQGETPLLDLGFVVIKQESVITASHYCSRLVLLVLASSLLTLTTAPITLTDGLERLLSPLRVIHFPAHEMAMMMTIALRFIPTLIEETGKIMSAQKARGADFESGSLFARAKALVPVLVPLFISAFRRADELAVAMECRLYRGGHGRTRLHQLKYTKLDLLGGIVVVLVCAGIIVLSRVSPV